MLYSLNLILIKDLVGILQYRINNSDLPSCVLDICSWCRAHERWPKDNGQILRVHAIDGRVLDDAVQVERQRS